MLIKQIIDFKKVRTENLKFNTIKLFMVAQ